MSYETARRVLVLQHPQEQDALLGSAQILAASLPKVKIVVGLSWKNFAHALGEEDADPRRWAVLFPDPDARPNTITHRGKALSPAGIDGIVVLDGTWSKAKTLWWRNAWLLKLNRMTLAPKEPSIYGKLRLEPRKELVSTLESVAAALTLCGEAPEIEAGLKRTFRTLVQRVRDAHLVPPARPRPSKKRRPLPAERRRERAARVTDPSEPER